MRHSIDLECFNNENERIVNRIAFEISFGNHSKINQREKKRKEKKNLIEWILNIDFVDPIVRIYSQIEIFD